MGPRHVRGPSFCLLYTGRLRSAAEFPWPSSQHGSAATRRLSRATECARLRDDLALALRAAAHHGLAEGVCNHFSVLLPDGVGPLPDQSARPALERGRRPTTSCWSTPTARASRAGTRSSRRRCSSTRPSTASPARRACCTPTCPTRPRSRSTRARALDTTLSQNAMRFHGRVAVDAAYNGLALDAAEGVRIAHAMHGADIAFLGNHGVVVCGERIDYAYDDLYYLERACMLEVLARSTGLPLEPVRARSRAARRGTDAGRAAAVGALLRRAAPARPARRPVRAKAVDAGCAYLGGATGARPGRTGCGAGGVVVAQAPGPQRVGGQRQHQEPVLEDRQREQRAGEGERGGLERASPPPRTHRPTRTRPPRSPRSRRPETAGSSAAAGSSSAGSAGAPAAVPRSSCARRGRG